MQREQVLRHLPDVIRRTADVATPLDGLVQAMVSLLDPVDQRLLHLERYFDPYRAPTAMLPFLACWVDLGWLTLSDTHESDGVPIQRLRHLIALAPRIAKRRGTPEGLELMLRRAVDREDIHVFDASANRPDARPFHLIVEVPAAASGALRLVELIVRIEKPVHLTHEVRVVDGGTLADEGEP